MRKSCELAVLLGAVLLALPIVAQAVTWTGSGTNGNWTTVSNWTGNTVPQATDDVVFDATTNKAVTVNTNVTVRSITISNYTGTVTQNSNVTVSVDFSMYSGLWRFSNGVPASLSVGGNMYVNSSTVQCQYASTTGWGTGRTFTVTGNLTLGASATLNGIGLGFAALAGPGRQLSGGGGGGGHGGMGGYWDDKSAGPGGLCYGSVKYPTSLGSGGAIATGGSAIRLSVTGTATVDGAILTDGGRCASDRGGGAGGSVWLTAGALAGSGIISARGSAPTNPATSFGSGGGGRIALYYNSSLSLPLANICAAAGKSPNSNGYGVDGGAGTVYIEGAAAPCGTLIIDNSNITTKASNWPWPTTLITNGVTDLPAGNVLIQNLGALEISANANLGVGGYWTNAGNFFARTGSTVSFLSTNAAPVTGNNTFFNLSCTNGGKLIVFEQSKTNTVQGLLTFQGAAGNRLTLRSSDTNYWYLKVTNGAMAHVAQYVDVARSYANGVTISAYNSTDSGSNVNWAFAIPGQTNTWIGTISTNWINTTNWDLGRVPAQLDTVVISNPCSFYPTLDDNKTINQLRIRSGALLRLAGRSLLVLSNATFNGALAASGTETITLNGDVDFTGGTFTNAQSTVVLGGTLPQLVTSDGKKFNKLSIVNTSALVRFTDDVVTTNLAIGSGQTLFSGALTATAAATNQGGTVSFAGPVSTPTLASYSGSLTFSNTLTATRFVNSLGNVTFKDNASVVHFQAFGQGTCRFNEGKLYAVTNLWLNGVSNAALLILRSSTDGNPWNLRVSRMSGVAFVDVKDSDASGGLPIEPILSTNSGGNANWDFGRTTNWAHWVGSVNSSFTNGANWSPAGAPGPTALLYLDGTYTTAPRLTNALTVLNLVIGGVQPVTLTVDAPLATIEDLTVMPNGVLTHTANTTTNIYNLNLTVGRDLRVLLDGQINVDGRGYAATKGLGAAVASQGGGGHGGEGGDWGNFPYGGGSCYGSVTSPVTLGSGGQSGPGGGAVLLNVTGKTKVAGVISASGTDASVSGAGAGGSVWLITDSIEGDGFFQAEGGRGGNYSGYGYGHGGGGRIAVCLKSGNDFGSVGFSAATRLVSMGGVAGGAGTVYLKKATQDYGLCILDNKGESNSRRTMITSNVTGAVVGDLVIRGAATLLIHTGQTLAVQGSITNNSTQTAVIGGTVLIGGTGTSVIAGTASTTAFYNLTCTTGGKEIDFAAGNTYTVSNALTLRGASYSAGNRLVLRSTASAAWRLIMANGMPQDIQYVDVQYSDARAGIGAPIQAYDSVNSGFNTNWVFGTSGAQTNLWNGATNTDWATADNWGLGRSTLPSDFVVITNGCPRYPTLDNIRTVAGLAISNGASMRLGGYPLTVSGDAVIGGSLVASGAETLVFGGDVNFTGGTFTQASSTVVIGGTNAQTITSGGNRFSSLSVTNTAGAVTFADAVSATNLLNAGGTLTLAGPATVGIFSNIGTLTFGDNLTAGHFICPTGGVTVTFHANSDYTITTNLELYGTASNRLVLRSSSPGAQWRLNSSGFNAAAYVDVRDSDARGGLTIYPLLSTNSGNNLNWDFTVTTNWVVWNGSASTVFSDGDNWTPAGAPSAGSLCFIDGRYSNAPSITSTTTVSRLVIGGAVTAALTVHSNMPLTVNGDLTVLARGTLTHPANSTAELHKLTVSVNGDLVVRGGGAIDTAGKGYAAGNGPGTGVASQGAGGHGGEGGDWGNFPYGGGSCYGSVTSPVTLGSGGASGPGGGAVLLNVTGRTKVAGVISASGADLPSFSGAGAGGSVWLTADSLDGDGLIQADGGRGGNFAVYGYSHGGGGRIAVCLKSGNDFGSVGFSAATRLVSMGGAAGGAGTVYLKKASQDYGTCIVDNKGVSNSRRTIITSNVTDTVVGDFIIRNASTLLINPNQTLTVCGSWSNGTTFYADSNSTVVLTGTNAATVYTPILLSTNTGTTPLTNMFWNLTCSNSQKQIYFQAGRTNIVRGMLTLYGVTLDSTVPGSPWYLRLDPAGTQSVKRVSVRDSNATNGQMIVAFPASEDRSNNVNWLFMNPSGSVFTFR
jgi:hypothetical protein